MGKVVAQATVSLDGYVAGPNESGSSTCSPGSPVVTSSFRARTRTSRSG